MITDTEVKKYGSMKVIDPDRRLFTAWATVNVRDLDGEMVDIESLEPYLPIFMDRSPPIIMEHTNKVVGKILSAKTAKRKDGTTGVLLDAKIFKDTKIEDQAWEDLKNEVIKGLSIGGEAERDMNKVLKDARIWEVSLTRNPACQEATIVSINNMAKSTEISKPFAGYENFDACVAQNSDKEDPKAYCAAIKLQVEKVEKDFGPKQKQDNNGSIINKTDVLETATENDYNGDKMTESKKETVKADIPEKPPVEEVPVEPKKEEVPETPVEPTPPETGGPGMEERMARMESSLAEIIALLKPVPIAPLAMAKEEKPEEVKPEEKKPEEVGKSVKVEKATSPIPTVEASNGIAVEKTKVNWNDRKSIMSVYGVKEV